MYTLEEYRNIFAYWYTPEQAEKLYKTYRDSLMSKDLLIQKQPKYAFSYEEEIAKDFNNTRELSTNTIVDNFKLDDFLDRETNQIVIQKKKKENPMYIANDKNIEASKLDYLLDRLSYAKYEMESRFRIQFGLEQDTPKTFEDALKRLQSGQYTYSKPKRPYWWNEGLRWTTVAEDYAGFDAALLAMKKAETAAKDIIMSGVYADGLAALQKFEAFTYTPAPAAAAA